MPANREPFRVCYNADVKVGDMSYTIEVSEIVNAENLPEAINIGISHARKWGFTPLSVEQVIVIGTVERIPQK